MSVVSSQLKLADVTIKKKHIKRN